MRSTLKICLCAFGFIASTPTNAQPLGRLFFTPEQRMQLEYDSTASNSTESGSSSGLLINGIVQKHGGPRTVWINGVARDAGKNNENSPESQTIVVPGKTQPVKAKVGQRILLEKSAPAAEKELDP